MRRYLTYVFRISTILLAFYLREKTIVENLKDKVLTTFRS